jgi:hypothetical protein
MSRRCAVLLAAALLCPFANAGEPLFPEPDPDPMQENPLYCYRAKQKLTTPDPDDVAWLCDRAADPDGDGCYDWALCEEVVVWGGDYTLTSSCLDECACDLPCFVEPLSSPEQFRLAADGSRRKSLRLNRLLSADATVDAFHFPKKANGHVIVWPENAPGFVVRIANEDGASWDVKLFPMTVVVNATGKGGDPEKSQVQTLRLGFQVEPLQANDEPMFTIRLSSLRPVLDTRHNLPVDGLYVLRLGKDQFFVKMKDNPA